MAPKSRQDATNRVTLTPQTVVEGALALAEAEGLGAVTIRRLAKKLGVTPMALYWHFRSKDELLDGMAATIFEEVDLSVDAFATWQEQLSRCHPNATRAS